MVSVTSSGPWKKTEAFLAAITQDNIFEILDHYGRIGVDLLSAHTPIETGETSESWDYEIVSKPGRHAIEWYNTHREGRVNIAVILQYGHGTGTGGWVEGRDYINPVMRPLFDNIVEEVWKAVRDA